MATTTTKLGLRKPAGSDAVNVTTDISDNMDKVDAAAGFDRVAAFPGSPFTGKPVMRSDLSDNMFAWNGTTWKRTMGIPAFTSTANRDAAFPSPQEGDQALVTANDSIYVYETTWKQTYFYNSPPKCRAKRITTQSTTSGVDLVVNWTGEDEDTNNMHDNVTNNTRITAASGGCYLFICTIPWDFNSVGKRQADFRVNGTTLYNGGAFFSGTAAREMNNISRLIDLAFGDYVEVIVNQNSGGALNIDGTLGDGCRIDAFWMGWRP